jgi:hypothetical protein
MEHLLRLAHPTIRKSGAADFSNGGQKETTFLNPSGTLNLPGDQRINPSEHGDPDSHFLIRRNSERLQTMRLARTRYDVRSEMPRQVMVCNHHRKPTWEQKFGRVAVCLTPDAIATEIFFRFRKQPVS